MAGNGAYSVHVIYPGELTPRERHAISSGAEVLAFIPKVLAQHGECEKIAIYNGVTFLFAVDCNGNRIES
jgi:hypothetical protein